MGLNSDELPILLELLRSSALESADCAAGLERRLLSLDARRLALGASPLRLTPPTAAGMPHKPTQLPPRHVRAASSTVSLVELASGMKQNGGDAMANLVGAEPELAALFHVGASARDLCCNAERISQALATDEGVFLALFLRCEPVH